MDKNPLYGHKKIGGGLPQVLKYANPRETVLSYVNYMIETVLEGMLFDI